jgi:hypothetical protein
MSETWKMVIQWNTDPWIWLSEPITCLFDGGVNTFELKDGMPQAWSASSYGFGEIWVWVLYDIYLVVDWDVV